MLRPGWLLALPLLGCAASLPSAEPLGEGPLAEDVAARRPAATAPEPAASAAAAAKPTPVAEADAGAEAARPTPRDSADSDPSDAGASEAAAPTAAGPAQVYAGLYVGEDVSTYRMPGNPETQERDPKARTRVEQRRDGGLVFDFLDSSSDDVMCAFEAPAPSGGTVSLRAGQHCDLPGGFMTFSLKQGTAVFAGERLSVDLEIDLELRAGGEQATGELQYHFEGTRR